MKEYRKVANFNYKGKKYALFIDKQDKYYFLGINDKNNYEYLDINVFLELLEVFSNPPYELQAKKDQNKKHKLIPKIIIGGILTNVTLLTFLGGCTLTNYYKNYKEFERSIQQNKESAYVSIYENDEKDSKISFGYETPSVDENVDLNITTPSTTANTQIPFVLSTEVDELKLDEYFANEYSTHTYIYDMNYLNMVLEDREVTLDDFYYVIDHNDKIIDRFKPFVKNYCKDYIEKQPNAERRVLYENLKTLEFEECDSFRLALKTMSTDAYACYVRKENKIYVHEDYEYEYGTWYYQVLYHELSHAARTGWWTIDGKTVHVQCEGVNFNTLSLAEGLNSIFAVKLFDYEERDIAYQLQSNYLSVIIESMDNYEISDYMNHSLSYFVKKLDEFHGGDYAQVFLELVETQYKDFHNDDIKLEQPEYYPIYEYISDVYYKNKITPDTTYEEARAFTDELLDRILFDVPEEYEIDTNYFYEYLDEYCTNLGIEISTSHRL